MVVIGVEGWMGGGIRRFERRVRETIDFFPSFLRRRSRLGNSPFHKLGIHSSDLLSHLLLSSNSNDRIPGNQHRSVLPNRLFPMIQIIHRSNFRSELSNLSSNSSSEINDLLESFDLLPLVEDRGTGRFVRFVVVGCEVGMSESFGDGDSFGWVEGEEFGEEVDS